MPLDADPPSSAPSREQSASPTGLRFDARRWTWSEQVVGIATLVLFVSLFMPWFGASMTFFDTPVESTVNGLWHGYMYIDLILALAILAYLFTRAAFETLPFGLPSDTAKFFLAGATSLNLLLALISFLTKPTGVTGGLGTSWQYGAYVGLIGAIVAAAASVGAIVAGALSTRTQVHR
jgi:hypothetical protein